MWSEKFENLLKSQSKKYSVWFNFRDYTQDDLYQEGYWLFLTLKEKYIEVPIALFSCSLRLHYLQLYTSSVKKKNLAENNQRFIEYNFGWERKESITKAKDITGDFEDHGDQWISSQSNIDSELLTKIYLEQVIKLLKAAKYDNKQIAIIESLFDSDFWEFIYKVRLSYPETSKLQRSPKVTDIRDYLDIPEKTFRKYLREFNILKEVI